MLAGVFDFGARRSTLLDDSVGFQVEGEIVPQQSLAAPGILRARSRVVFATDQIRGAFDSQEAVVVGRIGFEREIGPTNLYRPLNPLQCGRHVVQMPITARTRNDKWNFAAARGSGE